jgi:hypothetical protein
MNFKQHQVKNILEARACLGEGLVWDARSNLLY